MVVINHQRLHRRILGVTMVCPPTSTKYKARNPDLVTAGDVAAWNMRPTVVRLLVLKEIDLGTVVPSETAETARQHRKPRRRNSWDSAPEPGICFTREDMKLNSPACRPTSFKNSISTQGLIGRLNLARHFRELFRN